MMNNRVRSFLVMIVFHPFESWKKTIDRSWLAPVTLVLIITFITSGVSTRPVNTLQEYASYAANPIKSNLFSSPVSETPLFFFLAHLLGATTIIRYLILCACLLLTLYITLFVLIGGSKNKQLMSLFVLLFAAHPISYILLTWLGKVDILTVFGTIILLFSFSPIILGFTSFFLMINHTAAFLIAVPIILLRRISNPDNISKIHVYFVVLGLMLGKALLVLFFHFLHIDAATRLEYICNTPLTNWLSINIQQFPTIVYSLNFGLWIPIVVMIVFYFNSNRLLYGFYLMLLFLFYCVTFFTKDTTRVFALLSWGPTLHCLLYTWQDISHEGRNNAIFGASVLLCALFGWFFPHLYIFNGDIYIPWFEEIAKLLLR